MSIQISEEQMKSAVLSGGRSTAGAEGAEGAAGSALRIYTMTTEQARRIDDSWLRKRMPLRMEKADRFRFEKDRLLCMAAGFLMLRGLGLQDERALSLDGMGKPSAPGYPAFNVSHSGGMAVMAVAEPGVKAVGIDLEQIDRKNVSVAKRTCTPRELEWMRREEEDRRFFQLWTLKEAVMKASGMGLSLDPRCVDVLELIMGGHVNVCGQDWFARCFFPEGYVMSVCASCPVGEVTVIPSVAAAADPAWRS